MSRGAFRSALQVVFRELAHEAEEDAAEEWQLRRRPLYYASNHASRAFFEALGRWMSREDDGDEGAPHGDPETPPDRPLARSQGLN
jgi:hypothetical protein